jgi:thiol-disulfide isomerase/thioredoxin
MPIVLDCACGMKLRLADDLAGKRVRCPVCHATASVPAATPAPAALEDAPLIRIRCGCGKQFDVQAKLAGRTGHCPGCGEKLTVPAATAGPRHPPTHSARRPAEAAIPEVAPEQAGDAPTLDEPSPRGPRPSRSEAPTRAAEPPPQAAELIRGEIGDYELLREIARGGMGVVYKARQKSLGRVVALKMILGGQLASPEQVRRFHVEAEQAGQLDHPNIVPIYQVGEHQGQHFFSMKLIEGGSLGTQMGRFRKAPREAATLVATVARAVHYAHQRGVLHRDLKPGNILIDEDGAPHVTDFGLAKHLGEKGATQSGAILGTPGYMAPEQAAGQSDLTVAADVHGLGAVLYHLLSGQPPFEAESTFKVILRVMERDAPPLRPKCRNVPPDLETICLTCLQKDPARRYPSAAALADDLDRFLNGEPIQARPTTRFERLAKWARRRPAAAALLAVSATAVLVLLVGGWWSNARLQAALKTSETNRKRAELSADAARNAREQVQASFTKGLETVDDLLTNLDGRLAQKGGMESVRVEFLTEFLNFSRRLALEQPDDPAAKRQLGRVWARIGEVSWQNGQLDGGDKALREAIAVQKALAEQWKDQPQYRHDLATTHLQHARLLLRKQRQADARASLRQASEIADRLAADAPTQAAYRQFAVLIRFEQGNLAEETRQPEEAKKAYAGALARQEKLIADFPRIAPAHHLLGQIADSLASSLDGEAPAESLRLRRRALDAQREAWRLARHVGAFADELRVAYNELGVALRKQGRHADLADLAGRLSQDAPEPKIDTYNAGCFMANAAEVAAKAPLPSEEARKLAAGYAVQAVGLLNKAVQAGYAAARGEREHMDRDTDLDPLRERPDYKELIARIDQRLPPGDQTPASRVEALSREYSEAVSVYRRALADAVTVAQKRRAQERAPSVPRFADRFLALAEKDPTSPGAINALLWVLKQTEVDPASAGATALLAARRRALEMLGRDHLSRPDLGDVCRSLALAAEPEGDKLLQAIGEKHKQPGARGLAALALGLSLSNQASRLQSTAPDRSRSLTRQAEGWLQQVVDKYDAVPMGSSTLGAIARKRLHEVRHLSIGSTAQEISGEDLDGKTLRLSAYRGKVVVLDFWANWCGYCRMEYDFQRGLVERLRDRPFALLGINCDEDREVVKRVVQRQRLNWRSWFDGGGAGRRIQQRWQIEAFPTVYVLDHKGVIRHKGVRGPKLEEAVMTLLAEKEGKGSRR